VLLLLFGPAELLHPAAKMCRSSSCCYYLGRLNLAKIDQALLLLLLLCCCQIACQLAQDWPQGCRHSPLCRLLLPLVLLQHCLCAAL
jgi:hypothetical protein